MKVELRVRCERCKKDCILSYKDFKRMFPLVSVSKLARGTNLILFRPTECDGCSESSLKDSLVGAPRSLMKEAAG